MFTILEIKTRKFLEHYLKVVINPLHLNMEEKFFFSKKQVSLEN